MLPEVTPMFLGAVFVRSVPVDTLVTLPLPLAANQAPMLLLEACSVTPVYPALSLTLPAVLSVQPVPLDTTVTPPL